MIMYFKIRMSALAEFKNVKCITLYAVSRSYNNNYYGHNYNGINDHKPNNYSVGLYEFNN